MATLTRAASRWTCGLAYAGQAVDRDKIMAVLEERFLPDLSRHIVSERMIDPRHFRDTLNSYRGSAFSIAPILTQSAYFRPHNRSGDVPNLYFVGAGTHPAPAFPACFPAPRSPMI